MRSRVVTFILFFSCLSSIPCIAQKVCNVTIKIPVELDQKKIYVSFDNGIQDVEVSKMNITNGTIKITGKYFSDYASVTMYYLESPFLHEKSFFIQEKPAVIVIHKPLSNKFPFDNTTLKNCEIFESAYNKLYAFDSVERKAYEKFNEIYYPKVIKGESFYRDELWEKRKVLAEKDLEYLNTQRSTYFLFWFFRRKIVEPYLLKASGEKLLTTFNNVFSDSLRNSPGAKRISRLINGHINSTKGHLAPDFRLTDIYGNEIALKDYYHKSNVLLVFWATWCVPCMAEMPVLKGIRKQYSNNDLVMIFMSTDVDSLKFKSTLQSQQMLDWINIPRNMDLYYDYGNRNSIPQVYLINRKGFTIYSRNEEDDDELKKLKSLLSRLIN